MASRTALVLASIIVLGCRGGVTPRPAIEAIIVGDPAAEGTITAFADEDGRTSLDGSLGSGGDWGATIRSGSCPQPGAVEHIVGPVENGQIHAIVDEPLADLAGRIIVLTRLGSDVIAACGVLGGAPPLE
jgi:hypothetical protein